MNYLIVILEHNATSFCCYDVIAAKKEESGIIPLNLLRKAVDFSVKNNVPINFLYGDNAMPLGYEEVIEYTDPVRIVPLGHERSYENAVYVIDGERDLKYAQKLEGNDLNNIILRLGKEDIASLVSIAGQLMRNFRRLNVIWKGVGSFGESTFSAYANQLEDIGELAAKAYRDENPIEINVISDRAFLTNMNNCNAGIEHLTLAPNGRFYLCPAFYYEDEADSVGSLESGPEIKNARLLELENAPICRNCDAYQCKRCIYLNRKLTSELNTPSRQQCVLAHLERNASKRFLEEAGDILHLNGPLIPIPTIDYLDPFDIISDRSIDDDKREKHFIGLLSKQLEHVSITELLCQINRIDPSMLIRLKALNHGGRDDEEDGRQ
jgi:CXXX repeat peptide maturase